MPKPSHREKLLTEGLRVVHERGFGGASVRDIVNAAGVPQGSFTNHFASKEAFSLEVLDLYFQRSREVLRETVLNDALPPLQRLSAYVDANIAHIEESDMRNGCLIGNYSIEASEQSEVLRHRVVEIFAEIKQAIGYCLKAAVKSGELPPSTDTDELAAYVVSSLQGSILLAKAERTAAPMTRFKQMLFSTILGQNFDSLPGRKHGSASPKRARSSLKK